MSMPRRKRQALAALCLSAWLLLLSAGSASAASGNEVGANVGHLLKHYASELYGGVVAIIAVLCLMNRRYVELATFLFAAVVVAWMVFDPSDIATAAEAIGKQIFG
jgi:peptidoglycan/LPS O-acetylase OafA/YrhL